jgi:hypothetical protein
MNADPRSSAAHFFQDHAQFAQRNLRPPAKPIANPSNKNRLPRIGFESQNAAPLWTKPPNSYLRLSAFIGGPFFPRSCTICTKEPAPPNKPIANPNKQKPLTKNWLRIAKRRAPVDQALSRLSVGHMLTPDRYPAWPDNVSGQQFSGFMTVRRRHGRRLASESHVLSPGE